MVNSLQNFFPKIHKCGFFGCLWNPGLQSSLQHFNKNPRNFVFREYPKTLPRPRIWGFKTFFEESKIQKIQEFGAVQSLQKVFKKSQILGLQIVSISIKNQGAMCLLKKISDFGDFQHPKREESEFLYKSTNFGLHGVSKNVWISVSRARLKLL